MVQGVSQRRQRLEDEECSGQSLEVDNNQLRAIIEADLLTSTQEFDEELNVNHPDGRSAFEANWKGDKAWQLVPHELTTNQNTCHFKVSSYLILSNNELFLNLIVTCNKKWILYDKVATSSMVGLRRNSKAKFAPKRRAQSLFNGLPLVWSTTASWIAVKPLYLSMLSKLMRCTESCNVCGWHWSTEWALFSMTTPNCTLHN